MCGRGSDDTRDPDETRSPDETKGAHEIRNAFASLVVAMQDTYFSTRPTPMPFPLRLFSASGGAASFFVSSIALLRPGADYGLSGNVVEASIDVWFAIILLAATFFGLVIAVPSNKHGLVRLYLTGLILPALTISVVRSVWEIGG